MKGFRGGVACEIEADGKAVIVAQGPFKRGYVVNPASKEGQGLAEAETLYLDPVSAPGSVDEKANGTTVALTSGQSFEMGPTPAGGIWRANAAHAGHKFTVVLR